MIGKSNTSSYDNPLAYPIAPVKITSNAYQSSNPNFYNPNQQNPAPAAGGIVKSNLSSSENPLANFSYQNQNSESLKRLPLEAYKKNQEFYGSYDAMPTTQQQQQLLPQQYSPEPQYNPPANNILDRYKLQPLPPIQSQGAQFYQPMLPPQQQSYSNAMSMSSPRNETPLQQQQQQQQQQRPESVYEKNEHEFNQNLQEKNRIREELDSLSQYPFGRRFDNETSSFTNINQYNKVTYPPEASMYNNTTPYARFLDEPPVRLNRDNIIEKPNSLTADMPPYDPTKVRSGFHHAFDYDPWGKPGGGAPLIDPLTGKKSTKKSSLVWKDKTSLNSDDRARTFLDRNRPLSLEEQRIEREKEKQRRESERADYKSRTGADVASWFTYLENQKKKIQASQGVHLATTIVTQQRNFKNEAARVYHQELAQQMEERNRSNQLHKLKDDVAGIEHGKKWDQMWGKPGAGAPNPNLRRMRVMDSSQMDQTTYNGGIYGYNLIDGQQQQNARHFSYDPQDGEFRSSHKNFYDRPMKMRL